MPSIQAALKYIDSIASSGMIFDLERMRVLMNSLGNPQNRFQSIHIAGTNGKGSVAAMFYSILREGNKLVGLYTSPHLEKINERFQIAGKSIPSPILARLTHKLKRHLQREHLPFRSLSQFEFLTTLAFLWFAERKVEYAVVETGLGGRLDATNVMKNVILSIITNIDLDHTQWLGKNVLQIAAEKAGIIKPGVPLVTGAKGESLSVIKNLAYTKKAAVYVVPNPHKKPRWLPKKFPLAGPHQWHNAAIVWKGFELIKKEANLIFQDFKGGLVKTRWPGRFEELEFFNMGKFQKIVLDGAHNPAAAQVLRHTLSLHKYKRGVLLWGMLKDKDHKNFIKEIAPFIQECVIVPLTSTRSARPKELAKNKILKNNVFFTESLREGWEKALKISQGRPLLVTGSLYLVGAIRSLLRKGIVRPKLDSIVQGK